MQLHEEQNYQHLLLWGEPRGDITRSCDMICNMVLISIILDVSMYGSQVSGDTKSSLGELLSVKSFIDGPE